MQQSKSKLDQREDVVDGDEEDNVGRKVKGHKFSFKANITSEIKHA